MSGRPGHVFAAIEASDANHILVDDPVRGGHILGGRSIEGEEPQWRLIRGALYTASGIFVGLFVSAALQALLISE
jgi:hypothetical protein